MDMMMGAPSKPRPKQLRELSKIRTNLTSKLSSPTTAGYTGERCFGNPVLERRLGTPPNVAERMQCQLGQIFKNGCCSGLHYPRT